MAIKPYIERLKDPRWQRRRLEIMQRDDFACTICGDKTTTLNVHHRYYERGREPWDYPDSSLRTLCQPCHDRVTKHAKDVRSALNELDERVVPVAVSFLRFLTEHQAERSFPLPRVTFSLASAGEWDGFFEIEDDK